MRYARTVTGMVNAPELGTVACHQHLLLAPPREWRPDPDYAITDVERVLQDVREYAAAGGMTLVEMTPVGQRLDMRDIRRISEESGVHVIVTTGFSQEPSLPKWIFDASVDAVADLLVREITSGIEDTGIRAGVIKAGSSHDRLTPAEEKAFLAAARAQRMTGAPISTHTTAGTAALLQVETLDDAGADLSRVAIGHIDRYLQFGYLKMVAQTGVSLLFDGIGKTKYADDGARADMICRLAHCGFTDQILLGFDNGRRSYFPSYGGGPGQAHLIREFLPLLLERGMTITETRRITVENPARLFAF